MEMVNICLWASIYGSNALHFYNTVFPSFPVILAKTLVCFTGAQLLTKT